MASDFPGGAEVPLSRGAYAVMLSDVALGYRHEDGSGTSAAVLLSDSGDILAVQRMPGILAPMFAYDGSSLYFSDRDTDYAWSEDLVAIPRLSEQHSVIATVLADGGAMTLFNSGLGADGYETTASFFGGPSASEVIVKGYAETLATCESGNVFGVMLNIGSPTSEAKNDGPLRWVVRFDKENHVQQVGDGYSDAVGSPAPYLRVAPCRDNVLLVPSQRMVSGESTVGGAERAPVELAWWNSDLGAYSSQVMRPLGDTRIGNFIDYEGASGFPVSAAIVDDSLYWITGAGDVFETDTRTADTRSVFSLPAAPGDVTPGSGVRVVQDRVIRITQRDGGFDLREYDIRTGELRVDISGIPLPRDLPADVKAVDIVALSVAIP